MKGLPTIILAASLFVPTRLQAGHVQGTGADLHPAGNGAAWFVTPEPIYACVVVAPDFHYSRAAIVRSLQRAFDAWRPLLPETDQRSGLAWPTEIVSVDLCSTLDAADVLWIYAGVRNAEVDAVSKFYTSPLGFAHQTSYDAIRGRSSGFIWLSPTLGRHFDEPSRLGAHAYDLDALMMHELGHVFGVPHLSGTIMTDDLADVLIARGMSTPPAVEGRSLIYWDSRRNTDVSFEISAPGGLPLDADARLMLGGRATPPPTKALLVSDSSPGRYLIDYAGEGHAYSRVVFEQLTERATTSPVEANIFKRYLETTSGFVYDAHSRQSTMHLGKVTFALSGDSVTRPAVLTFSLGGKVELTYFDLNMTPHQLLPNGI